MRTRKEILQHVKEMDERDDNRDLHINDELVVVSCGNAGVVLMHKGDVEKNTKGTPGPRRHKNKQYLLPMED